MFELIQDQLESLGPAERRVADWILKHPRRATRMTLAEIAAACGSSEPTVIRFCRRLGLRGFRELAPRLTEAPAPSGLPWISTRGTMCAG